MKLAVINMLYEGQMPPSARTSMCTQQAQPSPPNWGTPKSGLGEKGVFLVKWAVVCLVGAHTVPRSGG